MSAGVSAFAAAVAAVRAGERDVADVAADVAAELTDPELLGLLDGDVSMLAGLRGFGRHGYNRTPIVAGRLDRLGIPGIRFTDGPRGIVMGSSTCFPVAMARGATWDPALEEEIGAAIGREGRAQGANLFGGVCVNLLRHPAWGRAQETFGEDPVHVGAMGAATTRGVRGHLMATVKHYALNSIENARFQVDVAVDDDVLHEVYLPHFRRVVDAGADAVMSAYNAVNGEWCGDNRTLLTDVLRDEWGFEGFVMSDFLYGHRDPVGSVAAGLDLEMPFVQQRARALPKALADGDLARSDALRAARRLLAAQVRWAGSVPDRAPDASVVASPPHRALARRAAAAGMVLLRNEPFGAAPLLPLDPDAVGRVAVLGALADAPNLGDDGSSAVRPPETVTMLAGLREALGPHAVAVPDDDAVESAVVLARSSDVAVVVVGCTAADEGEALIAMDRDTIGLMPGPLGSRRLAGLTSKLISIAARSKGSTGGDRERLTLRDEDEELIRAVAAVNPRTIVVVVAGSAVLTERWRHDVPAVLLAWYPGMEGGRALADVLTGAEEPGGRLPFAVPTDESHLPHFDRDARRIVYDRWWGQRRLDRDRRRPAFPLGFGLGYTQFELDGLELTALDRASLTGSARVAVANTGGRRGSTVVQVYADSEAGPLRPRRQLLGFAKVTLDAGEGGRIDVDLDLRPLARREPASREWSLVPGDHRLEAARHAGDPAAVVIPFDPT